MRDDDLLRIKISIEDKKKQKQNTKRKGRTPLIDDNKIVIIFHEYKEMGPFLSLSLAVTIYKSWIITYVISVPLKKIVRCIFIDSLCLYY